MIKNSAPSSPRNKAEDILIRVFIAFGLLFTLLGTACADSVQIIFTGQTHAMIYPCSCPIEVDGGVARRAALISELRKKNPNTLLLDSGNFFAAGLMDEFTQTTQMDMTRTAINLEAIALMKYDALAIGPDEFNFGVDFFVINANKYKLPLVSCNLQAFPSRPDNIAPYMLKEFPGAKVGVIGLTNTSARQKESGLNFMEPAEALKKAVAELKMMQADIIIVLSNFPQQENLRLINECPGFDILITASKIIDESLGNKIGNVLVYEASWQARKLGVISLDIKDRKITGSKQEMLRLSDKIPDAPEIQNILPRCFADINCRSRDGLRGTCMNPGSKSASCEFAKVNKFELLVITAKDCIGCDTSRTVDLLKRDLPGLNPVYLSYPEARAKKLVKDLGLEGLPAYLLPKDIENDKIFPNLKAGLEEKGGFYLIKSQIGGMAYFLDRPKKEGQIELFLSLYDVNAPAIIEGIKDFNPEIHLMAVETDTGFDAAKGLPEVEEYLRSVCVKKYYPKHFLEYLSCRLKNISSSWWESCLGDFDPAKIRACATSREGEDLLRENIRLNRELNIMFGPVYLWNNYQIFSTQGVPKKDDFERIFKKK